MTVLLTEEGNTKITSFIFFSLRERAEFNKSCNLIGSGSGWNFPIRPAHGGRNPSIGCVSLCDDLKFPIFFDTESVRLHAEVSVSKRIFIRQEVWK